MKSIINVAALCIAVTLFAVSGPGCASLKSLPPQTVAFNSIYSLEKITTATYDGYLDSVIQGLTSTNQVPQVSQYYNKFQASYLVALDAVQYNTNALAPASLQQESTDIINLITSLKGKK